MSRTTTRKGEGNARGRASKADSMGPGDSLPEETRPEDPMYGFEVADAVAEMNAAAADAQWFCQVMEKAENTRLCEWPGKTGTGRKSDDAKTKPWPGAADHEVHLVQELLDERDAARVAALKRGALNVMPMDGTDQRRASLMKQVLRYNLGTAMKGQMLTQGLRVGDWADRYGHALLYVGWKQERAVERRVLTLGKLVEVATAKNFGGQGTEATGTEGGDGSAPGAPTTGTGPVPLPAEEAAAVEFQILMEDAVLEAVLDPVREDEAAGLLLEADEGLRARGVAGMAEAKRAIRELRKSRTAWTAAATGAGNLMDVEVSYVSSFVRTSAPCWEALRPYVDVFYPAETVFEDNLEGTRWIARVKRLSVQQLREQGVIHGWDPVWVEDVIKNQRGKVSGFAQNMGVSWGLNGLGSRWRTRMGRAAGTDSTGYTESQKHLIEIVEMHDRSTTPDGLTGMYKTVFHALVKDRVAKRELLEYWSGRYPFVPVTSEKAELMLLDSRGIPERLKGDQDAIKVQWDSRTNAASLTTLPPWTGPVELKGTVVKPGSFVESYRAGEVSAFQMPSPDGRSIEIEKTIRTSVNNRFGRMSADVPEPKSMMMGQADMDWFLGGISRAVELTAQLIQQFMPPLVQARVLGTSEVFNATPEEVRGSYDFQISFDVRGLDLEWAKEMLTFVKDLLLPMDRKAQMDTGPLLTFGMNLLDPALATQCIRPVEEASASEEAEEKASIADIFSGGAGQPITEGMDYGLRSQVLTFEIKRSPMRQQVMMTNGQIREVMTDRLRQLVAMQQQYQENAEIGRNMGEAALQPQSEAEVLLEELEGAGASAGAAVPAEAAAGGA